MLITFFWQLRLPGWLSPTPPLVSLGPAAGVLEHQAPTAILAGEKRASLSVGGTGRGGASPFCGDCGSFWDAFERVVVVVDVVVDVSVAAWVRSTISRAP